MNFDFLHHISGKQQKKEELLQSLSLWRFEQKKIVFTNGCFDLLHAGHVQYLAQARSLGDKLIVGLNSDASVKRLKGQSRPINDETTRNFLLAALAFVDVVVLFEEDTPLSLITMVQPDFLVKGGDYSPETIIGASIAKNVVVIPFLEGYSTTNIEQKILRQSPFLNTSN